MFEISEYVKIRIDEDDKRSVMSKQGKFIIKNNANQFPIVGMDILLNNYLGTKDKQQNVPIKLISPTKSMIWEYQNFEITPLKVSVDDVLKMEYFDPQVGFLFNEDHECFITMEIVNDNPFDLIDITLLRDMDENFIITPKNQPVNSSFEIKKNLLNWKIPIIKAKSKESVELKYKINLENPQEVVKLGKFKFMCSFSSLVSGMYMEDIYAYTSIASKAIVSQNPDNDQLWNCHVEFLNNTEFELALESIIAEQSEPPFTSFFEYPSKETDDIITIAPGESWKSESWEIESDEAPFINAKFKFSVVPTVSYLTEYEVIKEQALFKTNIEIE